MRAGGSRQYDLSVAPLAKRVLGIDFGERRIGLAISDCSGTLARPLRVLDAPHSRPTVITELAALIDKLAAEDDGLGVIVVGLPKRLDGTVSEQTAQVEAFAKALAGHTVLPIVFQDERLTSWDAETQLAQHVKDWRQRKRRLDAASAAIMLQDYLDQARRG